MKAPWIDATKRTPEDGVNVLVYWGDHLPMEVAYYREDIECWSSAHTFALCDADPTHWMALPEKPK